MIYTITITIIVTLISVMAVFYFIGRKVENKKKELYKQYFDHMKEVKMKQAKEANED